MLTDTVVITLGSIAVTGIGAVQAVIINMLKRQRSDIKNQRVDTTQIKEQIVNHHPQEPNFRIESDERHAETRSWFSYLSRQIGRLAVKQEEVAGTVNELVTGFLENRERIEEIERKKP